MTNDIPLTLHSFPRAIVHIDADAFFASCEQARDPKLRGRPVVTGKERGIAASMIYEANAQGVTRGMRIFEIKKLCHDAVILPSDYETYGLLSKNFYAIVRRYTPEVEEYSIDECFADLTGLRQRMRMNYAQMAERLKHDLDSELGFTFSVGLGPNKVIAKIGSKWKKPSGLTVIPGNRIHEYLAALPVEKVWGIGPQTTAFLNKYGMGTALDFARQPEEWVRKNLTKPHIELWQELNGHFVLPLGLEEKTTYATIQKVKTFTPPSDDRDFVFAQLSKNIENACIKARRYKLAAAGAIFFLRQQDFRHTSIEVKSSRPTSIPSDMIELAGEHFSAFFKPGTLYRSTGVILLNLTVNRVRQLDLFGAAVKMDGMIKLYEQVDHINDKYGKHKVFLGTSWPAHQFQQHLGERGDLPERTRRLLPGETKRKRLGYPMIFGM